MKQARNILFIVLVFLTSCTVLPSNKPNQLDDLTTQPESSYPQPETFQPFYFSHQLETNTEETVVTGRLGDYQLYITRITNITDPEIALQVNAWIDRKIEIWVDKGLPKYPGILNIPISKISSPINLRVFVYSAINNIANFTFTRSIAIGDQFYEEKEEVYVNLKTGQEITLNDVLNAPDGLSLVNQHVITAFDTFEETEDPNEFTSLITMPFISAFRGLEAPLSFELDYPNHGLTIWLDPVSCPNCNYQLGYQPKPLYLPKIISTMYDRFFDSQKDAYVTDGTFQFNQPWRIPYTKHSHLYEHSTFDKKRHITLQREIPEDVPAFLLKEAQLLLEQLRTQIIQFEEAHQVSLNVSYQPIVLEIIPGNLANTIHLSYNLGDRPFFNGELWRNYHPQTGELLRLSDFFQQDFALQDLIDHRISLLVATAVKDETIAMVDDRNFSIVGDAIHVYVNKAPESTSMRTFSRFNLPIDYIGIEHFDFSSGQK